MPRKFKLDEEFSKRVTSLSLAGVMLLSGLGLSGCTKNESYDEGVIITNKIEKDMFENTNDEIICLFPELDKTVVKNSSLILLLDEFAKKDENGKISSSAISNFKSIIDTDNMISDFNSFLDLLEYKMISENKLVSTVNLLSSDSIKDREGLKVVEEITESIINSKDKDEIIFEFNKLYTLFVEEESLDNNNFEIRDLSYSVRALASVYARVGAYYSRNYISSEKYEKIDKRTNDQNSKAYIKTILEILKNEMNEESFEDTVSILNSKYDIFAENLNGKVTISNEDLKNIVNYINLEYISSDLVSTKDKNVLIKEYDEADVSNAILAIDSINEYNLNNQNNIIIYSNLVANENKADKVALDFIEYNSIMLLNTVNESTSFSAIYNNPYFQNLYKYFTKQNFVHIYKDENGNVVESNINWQEISDGVNFINNNTILYTLTKLSRVDKMDNFINLTTDNLSESVQYIQNTTLGECKKVDSTEFVKIK